MKKTPVFLLIIFLIPIIFSALLYGNEKKQLVPINFEVQWFPQSQFAGYIMAYEKGFYKNAGLDVKIIFSNGEDSPLTTMLDGKIDFCTAWLSQAILLRSNGKPIVNICQMFQKSSLMLVSLKESNISTPADMNGKCISSWGGDFSIQPNAFFRKYQIDAKIVPQSFTIDAFLAGACDLTSGMYYNEYHKLFQAGINEDEVNTFFYSDYGLNFPEDGIYCTENTLESKPEICQKFVAVSLQGWEYAFSHQQETLDLIMKYCNKFHLQTNSSHQKWMLNAVHSSITYQTGEGVESWGNLKKDDFFLLANELKEQNIIERIPNYKNFYKGQIK
ncbi:MAG: ABC transporter substrate-binding protein [Candidatus Cloacimonadota bacterium]|nr:ABC transporter substrate-binding protein [Candidatus Cloacimonadota bacterium]